MRTKEKFFGAVKKAACLALAFAMAITLVNPMTVEAKKKVTLPAAKADFSLSQAEANAVTVGKGKTTVIVKKAQGTTYAGFVKFVAPSTKNYAIKTSNIKGKGLVLGNIYPCTYNGYNSIEFAKLKTPGKDKHSMAVGSKDLHNYKANRTAKLKLEAGQPLYIYFSMTNLRGKKTVSVNLSIK